MSPGRRIPSAIVGLLALFGAATLAVAFGDPAHQPGFSDLGVYRAAGLKLLEGRTPYDVVGHYTFNYPPFAALVYGLTLGFPTVTALPTVYYGVTVLAWLVLVILIARAAANEVAGTGAHRSWPISAVLLFAITYGVGLRDELKLGQTMVFPFLAVIAGWKLLEEGEGWNRQIAAALLLGFAIQMKIYFWTLLPLLVFRGRWRIAAGALASHLVFNFGVVGVLHGWSFIAEEHARWLETVVTVSEKFRTDRYNSSWVAMVAKSSWPSGAGLIRIVAVLALLALQWRARREPGFWQLGMTLAAIPIVTPVAWPYWMLLSSPLFLLLALEALARPSHLERWAGLVLFWNIAIRQNEPFAARGGLVLAMAALLFMALARVKLVRKPA